MIEAHYGVGPFCGGCPFSTALHTGCTADPERSGFRVLEPEKIAKFTSVAGVMNGLANKIFYRYSTRRIKKWMGRELIPKYHCMRFEKFDIERF